MKTLEICCGDAESVRAAINGGADRIELCSALECGGLTPSAGLMRYAIAVRNTVRKLGRKLDVNILIRPRPGDFLYSGVELNIMAIDIETAVKLGADGIVLGALTADGKVDVEAMKRLLEPWPGVDATFHRAIDVCRDPVTALSDIMALGCKRVLTSGGADDALSGADTIRELVQKAQGRISIMAGSGVNAGNISEIVKNTGVDAVHASARRPVNSAMAYRNPRVSMGAKDADEYQIMTTSESKVRELSNILRSMQ